MCEGEKGYAGAYTEGVGAIVVGHEVPAVGVGAPVVGSTVGSVVGMYVGLPGKGVGKADVGEYVGKSVGMNVGAPGRGVGLVVVGVKVGLIVLVGGAVCEGEYKYVGDNIVGVGAIV